MSFVTIWYFTLGVQPFGWRDFFVSPVRAVSETISCNSGGSRTLTAGTYTNSDGTTFSTGGDLTLNVGTTSSCTFTINGSISLASLTVQSGVTLTHGSNTNTQTNTLTITTTGNIDIQSGAAINIDGKGYGAVTGSGSNGYGNAKGIGGNNGGGAGHGGNGGVAADGTAGGTGDCNISNPTTMGSSGGDAFSSTVPGAGGGLLTLSVSGTLNVSGSISARGSDATVNGGGGAGGGIKITAGTITGTPTSFSIAGGAGGTTTGGGGGGGCALIVYTNSNTITPTSSYFTMGGGAGGYSRGGAGVVLVKSTTNNGNLYAINSGSSTYESPQNVSSLTVDSITLSTSSVYLVNSTNNLTVANANPFSGGDGTGILRLSGTGAFTPTSSVPFTIAGTTLELYRSVSFTASSSINLVLATSGTFSMVNFTTTTPLALAGVTVQNGGTLTHGANTSIQSSVLNISAPSITVDSGGSISVAQKGYTTLSTLGTDGRGPGKGTGGNFGGGAGHGGAGGTGFDNTAAGSAYCSASNPATIGSSGGNAYSTSAGGAGGGLMLLSVSGTLTINGTLTAVGGTGVLNGGAGAGGGIKITAGSIAGTPTSFTAAGGSGGASKGGGGGGGCVYLSYGTLSFATSTISVAGGSGGHSGSTGTITAISSNSAPTVTAISPSQTSTRLVTVTTTIADVDANATSLAVLYSTNGTTWASSTIATVSASTGNPTTSTGSILGIAATTSVALTFTWNVGVDIPNISTTTAYLKITPNDGSVDGTAVSSSAFTVDTLAPAAPVVTDPAVTTTTVETASYTVVGTAEASSLVSISGGASTATGTATGGNFSISVPLSTDTVNHLVATTADTIGNTSSSTLFDIIQQTTSSYHFVVTGTATQTAGTQQTITLTLKSGAGNTVTTYSGDKNIFLSGATNAASGTHPTCTDKNSADTNFGATTTLTFTSGVATCALKVYTAESAAIDATDGVYTSTGNSAYHLSVVVAAGTVGYMTLQTPASVLGGTAFVATSTIKDTWWNTVTSTSNNTLLTVNAGSVSPSSVSSASYATNGTVATNVTITPAATEVSSILLTFTNGSIVATSSLSVTGVPAAPGSVSASRSSDSDFIITWSDNSTVESGYSIERMTDTGSGFGSWTQIATVATSTSVYHDTGVAVDRRYQYRVQALGQGSLSGSDYGTDSSVHYTTPAAPSGVSGTRTSDTQFSVAYTDNAAVTNLHAIERCDGSGCDTTYTAISGSPFSSSPQNDLGTTVNSRYRWRVAAETPTSSPENLLSTYASSNYEYTTPAAPSSVTSTRVSDTQLLISWSDNSGYEDGFRVETTVDGGSWQELTAGTNTVGNNVTSTTFTTSTIGHYFSFRVRAHVSASAQNSELFSAYGSAPGSIHGRPSAPGSITATRISDSQIDVSWLAVTFADSYKLWMQTDSGSWAVLMSPANTLSYSTTAISENHAYLFRVQAIEDVLESDYTTSTPTIYTSPTAPSVVTSTYVSDTQITVTWSDQSNYEDGFLVRLSTNDGAFQNTTTTLANVTSYVASSSISANHKYVFDVASFNATATSSRVQSNIVYTTPSAPSSATSTISTSSVAVSWTDNSAYEDGFRIEAQVDGGSFVTATTTAVNATSVTITTTTADHNYVFRLSAVVGARVSDYATTSINYAPLSVPTAVAGTRLSDTQISVSWTNTSIAQTGFHVQMSEDGGAWATVATVSAGSTSTTISSGIAANHQYRFQVEAYNTQTSSGYSSVSSIVYTTPSAPSSITGTFVSDSSISLSWVDASNAEDGFRIEVRVDNGSWSEITAGTNTVSSGVTTYSYTGSSENHMYDFRIRAARDSLFSSYTTTTSAIYTTPTAPSALTATYVSDSLITLHWTDNAAFETGFTVQYKQDTGSWQTATTTAGNSTTASFTSGSANHAYLFKVLATIDALSSSAATTNTAIYTSLPAPTMSGATVVSSTAITWSWTDNSNYSESTYIHLYTNGSETTLPISSTSTYTATVSPNTQYLASVSSYRADRGESARSASSSAVYSFAAIPANLSLTAHETSISVSWEGNGNSAGTKYYANNTTQNTNSGWSTATSWSSTGLTCNTSYSFVVKARNNSEIESSSTAPISLSTSPCPSAADSGGGAGTPFLNFGPIKPGPSSANPQGGFGIRINNDASQTGSPDVILTLFGGPDTEKMAISNSPDFSLSIQEQYGTGRTWRLTPGDGFKTVYAKFFNKQGAASEVVASSIVLNTAQPEIKVHDVPSSFDRDQVVVIEGTTKPGAIVKGKVRNEEITASVKPDGTWKIVLPRLDPGAFALTLNAKDLFGKESVPTIVPIIIRQPLKPVVLDVPILGLLTPLSSISSSTVGVDIPVSTTAPDLSQKPLPTDLVLLMNKLPELGTVLHSLGVKSMSDVERLAAAQIFVPTLRGVLDIPKTGEITNALMHADVPSEILFVKAAGNTIDVQPTLSVTPDGQVNQVISSVTGRQLTLIVKPESGRSVDRVEGRIVFKSRATAVQRSPVRSISRLKNFLLPETAFVEELPPGTDLVLQTFVYSDPQKNGVYTASIQTPAVDGTYTIVTDIVYKEKEKTNTQLHMIMLVDPEGYVYEKIGDQELRLKNVTVSLFWLNPATHVFELWPANTYLQGNPILTNVTGRFSFLAPDGTYYLQAEERNHETYKSDPFVLSQNNEIHTNIEMKPRSTPSLVAAISNNHKVPLVVGLSALCAILGLTVIIFIFKKKKI